MLKEYIFGLLDFQKYVHVLEVRKSDLFNVDKVGVSFDMKHTFSQCILDHHSTDFDNVKSLGNFFKEANKTYLNHIIANLFSIYSMKLNFTIF